MPKSPPKKLILVVHGIGEQAPGETLDYLVGASAGNEPAHLESEVRWLREEERPGGPAMASKSKDSAAAAEIAAGGGEDPDGDDEDREAKLFPVHIRRIEPVAPDDAEQAQDVGDRKVFAEVYWADLSRGREGLLGTGYEFVKGVLGLGHLVRENADQLYPRWHPLNWMARLFVWTFHGPIIGLTALLSAAAAAAYVTHSMAGSDFGQDSTAACRDAVTACGAISDWATGIVMLLIATAAALFGAWGRRRRPTVEPSYLFRIFANWLLILGIALAIIVLLTGFPEPWRWTALRDWITDFPNWAGQTPANVAGLRGFSWFGMGLLTVLQLLWFFTLIGLSILFIGQFLLSRPGLARLAPDILKPRSAARVLYPIVIGMMVILWGVATFAFTGAAKDFLAPPAVAAIVFEQGVRIMFVTGLVVLVVAGTAMLVWVIRWRKTKSLRRDQKPHYRKTDAVRIPRLLVNSCLGYVLIGTVLAFTAAALCARLGIWFDFCCPLTSRTPGPEGGGHWLWEKRMDIMLGLFTGIGLLYVVAWKPVSTGLAIGKDVLTYFRREPGKKESDDWSYPLRERIERRFDTVLDTMVASEKPTEIEVIAHSLGSVVAIEALRGAPEKAMLTSARLGKAKRKLATMGSPYLHLLERYFSKDFEHPSETEMPLAEWLNIFRIDDFVGTGIGKLSGKRPENEFVSPGGHTGYWTDNQVLKILKAKGFL